MGPLEEVLTFPRHAHSARATIIGVMKTTTSLIAAVAAVLGIGGAATAYQLAATPTPTVQPVSQTVTDDSDGPVAPEIEEATHFRWAPCKAPAVQQGDACVTQVVNTVVVPAPAAPGVPSSHGDDDSSPAGGGGGDDQYDDDDDSTTTTTTTMTATTRDEDDHEDDDGEDEPGDD